MGDSTDTGNTAAGQAEVPARHRRPQVLVVASGLIAVSIAAWSLLVAFRWHPGPLSWLVALTPWSFVLALAGLACAALARSRRYVVVSLIMLLSTVLGQLSLFVGETDPGGERFTVATINMLFGQGDPREVVAMVEEHDVDVLSVQELTPEAEVGLLEAGLADLMPYSVTQSGPRAEGTGLWSRVPIQDPRADDSLFLWTVTGRIELAGEQVSVYAVHPVPPSLTDSSKWERELGVLADLLASTAGPVIAAGDFNTTPDHGGFKELEDRGFVDGAQQAGVGFLPTFPQERLPWPLVTIDHVIARAEGLVAIDADTVVISGSDHRALVVEYATSP